MTMQFEKLYRLLNGPQHENNVNFQVVYKINKEIKKNRQCTKKLEMWGFQVSDSSIMMRFCFHMLYGLPRRRRHTAGRAQSLTWSRWRKTLLGMKKKSINTCMSVTEHLRCVSLVLLASQTDRRKTVSYYIINTGIIKIWWEALDSHHLPLRRRVKR